MFDGGRLTSSMNGELLQAPNWLCNKGLRKQPEIPSGVRHTLVTLTHPGLLATFRLKPFFFWHLTMGMGV